MSEISEVQNLDPDNLPDDGVPPAEDAGQVAQGEPRNYREGTFDENRDYLEGDQQQD